MGNGTRILLNSDGVITNWEKQYFEPVKSPLAAIANPIVAFDLLTPVDNSRHGFSVQQGVQILKGYGLEFPGSAGSQTTFAKSGLSGLSFLTAFRLSAVDVFQYVLDCRDLTPVQAMVTPLRLTLPVSGLSFVSAGLTVVRVSIFRKVRRLLRGNGMWHAVSFLLTAITN